VLAHVIAHVGPDPEQDALALVVTGTVLMGFAEITGGDWSVHGRDDFGQGDGFGRSGQDVPAANATLGTHEAHALHT
jgi:hypothetical protein